LSPEPPLRRATLRSISNNYSTWKAFGGVYVDDARLGRRVTEAVFEGLRGRIQPRGWLSVISGEMVHWFRRAERVLEGTRYSPAAIIALWDRMPLLGHTAPDSARSVYWRKRVPPRLPIDPDTTGCGLLWNAFVLPFDGAVIEGVLEKVDALML